MKIKRDINDTVFSRLVRHRADWKCERCTRQAEVGSMGLHASHYIGRAHRTTRFDFDNVDALCYGCHQFFETHKQDHYREWKLEKLGKKRFDALTERGRVSNPPTKQELVELRKVWREELREKYHDTV